jgi:transglutaminase-like putative cysteine protease
VVLSFSASPSYATDDFPVLQAYLLACSTPADETLMRWMASVWQPGEDMESYALLQRLNLAIHSLISYRRREEPGVQSPSETLISTSGSCRDLAFLFMEAAKHLGFAARFVSGYSCTSLASPNVGSTHAWAEVFLPGASWKGFDPTRGEIVGLNHVPVAVGRLPQIVPPIAGSFSGNAELQSMDVTVTVECLDS